MFKGAGLESSHTIVGEANAYQRKLDRVCNLVSGIGFSHIDCPVH
jgi:hypothetical protein